MTNNKTKLKIKMDNIVEVLEIINDSFFRKRIKNEFNVLCKDYSDISISVDDTDKKNTHVYIKDRNRSYLFVMNTFSYPFTAPEIYVNNHKYYDFLRINSDLEREMLKKMTGIECLNCCSFGCNKNWNPLKTIKNVIDEIDNVYKIRKNILNKLIADKIKVKYLLPEIDLDCWFF